MDKGVILFSLKYLFHKNDIKQTQIYDTQSQKHKIFHAPSVEKKAVSYLSMNPHFFIFENIPFIGCLYKDTIQQICELIFF